MTAAAKAPHSSAVGQRGSRDVRVGMPREDLFPTIVTDGDGNRIGPMTGTGQNDMGTEFPTTELMAMFRSMLRIRLIEEAIALRYPGPQPEQKMRCPVHLSIGQEAVPVAVCAELRVDDQLSLTHRCHAQYLAKGGDLKAMMAEIYGKVTGCCGGRGGSMHLYDDAVGVLASLPIVGSAIPIAVGAALAMRQEGGDRVAAAFFGDGASEEGVFHESLNFASVKNLPVLFVLENNFYSVYTGLSDRQPARPLTKYAEAHGVAAVSGDGNDVVAVRRVAREAVARARAGQGPTLLVFETYRWREHCGPFYDNNIGYRTEEEFQSWKRRCPVDQLRTLLRNGHGLTETAEAAMVAEIEAEIALAFEFAESSPFPDAATAGDMVYA